VKSTLPLTLLTLSALFAVPALAADTPAPAADSASPRVSLKETPDLLSLPETTFPELRTPDVPKRIEAGEKLPGIWVGTPRLGNPVAAPPAARSKKRARKASKKASPTATGAPSGIAVVAPAPLSLHVETRDMPRIEGLATDGDGRDVITHDTCFSPAASQIPNKDTLLTFGSAQESVLVLSTDKAPSVVTDFSGSLTSPSASPLRVIRAERLLVPSPGSASPGSPSLELTFAFIDLRSGGARLIRRDTIPLRLVQRAPGGLQVFAYRKGTKASFVIQSPPPLPDRGTLETVTVGDSDGGLLTTACHHVTVDLDITKVGEAATSTVAGELAMRASPPPDADPDTAGEVKVRPYRLSLSESWTSHDISPVLSASFGWTGPLRREGQER
jgi:hypothetical protein